MDKEGVHIKYTEDNIAVIHINNGENRINLPFIQSINRALDQVEGNEKCRGLITTGSGKFFSNGLDLAWIQRQDQSTLEAFRQLQMETYQRLITFPVPTVAAINGHAFAAGAFFAMAHDYRVMRSDRGWITWNETLNKLRFPESSLHFIEIKLPNAMAKRDAIIYAKRFTAREAITYGIVDVEAQLQDLIPEARKLINRALGPTGIDRKMLSIMKSDVYQFKKNGNSKL